MKVGGRYLYMSVLMSMLAYSLRVDCDGTVVPFEQVWTVIYHFVVLFLILLEIRPFICLADLYKV